MASKARGGLRIVGALGLVILLAAVLLGACGDDDRDGAAGSSGPSTVVEDGSTTTSEPPPTTTSGVTTTTTAATTTTTVVAPSQPTGVEASGPPCGGSAEVCVWWDIQPGEEISSFDLFRGESGGEVAYYTSVSVGDLFDAGGRYEFIDVPTGPVEWPLCYAVTAVTEGVPGPRSATVCTEPESAEPPPAPGGVEAGGPPCGGSEEICVWWNPVPGAASYVIYRGENGTVGDAIATPASGDLFLQGDRFEYIDWLGGNPPVAADPWPMCYAVAAVVDGVVGSPSAPACTSPG